MSVHFLLITKKFFWLSVPTCCGFEIEFKLTKPKAFYKVKLKNIQYLLKYKLRSESEPDVDISISLSRDIWTDELVWL